MKAHPEKRYNIAATKVYDASRLREQADIVRDVASDYTIECGEITILQGLLNEGYRAYLRFPISDWETFVALINMGVSDIYIDGPLGFQCRNINLGKKNTKVRVSPTISPNAALTGLQPSSFFIRPEDLDLYEKIVDIIDFRLEDQEKEDALFQIYNRRSFIYGLENLLVEATFTAPNPFIKPEFGDSRLNCGQRCRIPSRSCHLCESQIELTNVVYDFFSREEKEDDTNGSVSR